MPNVRVVTSLADAGVNDPQPMDDPIGAFQVPADGETALLLPINGWRYALVRVGLLGTWRCGPLGDLTAVRTSDVWKVTYQAHHAESAVGPCFCGDDLCSLSDPDAACNCNDPRCPLGCGDNSPDGPHREI